MNKKRSKRTSKSFPKSKKITIKISNIKDLTSEIEKIKSKKDNNILWFRGHSDSKYKLTPYLFRIISGQEDIKEKEQYLIKRFKQSASMILPNGNVTDEWDWLFMMQHHGVPTRLLDWSESPLVGLFFALENHDCKKDAALWVLNPVELNRDLFLDSKGTTPNIPSFGHEEILENYNPNNFLKEGVTSLKPIAVIAKRNTSRMLAQQGVFTIFHRDMKPLDNSKAAIKIIIPKHNIKNLKKELSLLGMSRFSLFPNLDELAKKIREEL